MLYKGTGTPMTNNKLSMPLFSRDWKTMAFVAMSLTFILSLMLGLVRSGVVVFNAALFAAAYSGAGYLLLKPISKQLSLIYRINACLFFFMALLMIYRMQSAWSASTEVFANMSEWVVNQLTFLVFSYSSYVPISR